MCADAAAPTVCAVVVTYNRLELLEQALDRLESQTRRPDAILVVDNASTDGTPDAVLGRGGVELLRLAHNGGGAGGFAAGLEHARARGFDWYWLLDDDTLVDEGCLDALIDGLARTPSRPMLMTSLVRWKDGSIHPMNRPWPRFNARTEYAEAVAAGLVPVRSASFVSTMVHRDAVDRHGLPHAEFFIWHDDTEYTRRVLNDAWGYLVPESTAAHWTPRPGDVVSDPRGRFYFKVRNHIWMVRGEAFRGVEQVWGWRSLATAVATYVARSDDRRRAVTTVARGIRDGLRRVPWKR